MRIAVVACGLLSFGSALAQNPEAFPKPVSLEPAVTFWTRVYTEVGTDGGFIHDSLRLDIVYEAIDVPRGDSGARERSRRTERALEKYRRILTKLAGGARSGLDDDEQRVLGLFGADVSNAELRAAAGRLRFQLGQADRFRAGLERSGEWKPYIYGVLEERGLPRELAVLPHVESSFDPTAYSKVGAAGMWQFMRSTGVRYMRIDHIVDERRDPFLSTRAAARLLEDNYAVVNTWPLALTGYNHGVAGMRRAVAQVKTSDIGVIVARYQSASFGFASRNFYAAFLAALEVDSNPDKYFERLRMAPPSDTETITVPDYMTVDTLADALEVRKNTLRDLNPALTDTVWAGDKRVPKGFELRLPRDAAAVAVAKLIGVDPAQRFAQQVPDVEHRVRRGDTLSAIAAEYRVSLAALMRLNGLGARDLIRVGQRIKLPVDAAPVPRVPDEPEVVLVRNDTPPPAGASGTYVVRSGDSIERIARRVGVSQEELLAANSLRNRNLIYPGQTLRVPGAVPAPTVAAVLAEAAPSAEAVLAAADVVAPTVNPAALETSPAPPVPSVATPEPAPATAETSALEPEAVVATIGSVGFVGPPVLIDAPATDATPALTADEVDAALAAALPASGDPTPDTEAASPDSDELTEVNALATVQAELAADPSDYSVTDGGEIVVQALETLGHYADWLEIPTQRLRDVNGLPFRQAVVIGQDLKLDFSRVDAATFEQRRLAWQQQRQSEFFASWQIADIEDYTVRSGDSLWVLAARTYKVPVWLLRQYNPDLDLDRVQPGTVVKFPKLREIGGETAAAPGVEVVADNAP